MWKRNFKSTQAYRQHKGGVLHIVISSLLEYEITQNASLRLIWSHTALEQPLEWLRHQYPQYILTVDSLFPKGVGSLGALGVSESQNHELYYSPQSCFTWSVPLESRCCRGISRRSMSHAASTAKICFCQTRRQILCLITECCAHGHTNFCNSSWSLWLLEKIITWSIRKHELQWRGGRGSFDSKKNKMSLK